MFKKQKVNAAGEQERAQTYEKCRKQLYNEEAKPCPFCGNKDIRIRKEPFNNLYLIDEQFKEWVAVCTVCGARGGYQMLRPGQDAVQMWNMRADWNEE